MKTSLISRLSKNLLGVLASLSFFVGSTLFLPALAQYAIFGVWLFMTGSALMLIDIVRPQ